MLVKKLGLICDYRELQQFTVKSLDLYDEMMVTKSVGIDFVRQEHAIPEMKEAFCQICGDPLDDKVVFCKSCKTPHHMECWQYNGACSTYGCGQKKCVS